MKIRLLLFLVLFASLGNGIAADPPKPPKLVVAILVDQLRYDYLERFHDQFTTNGFKLFTERGVFMTWAHYNYFPTVTAPGHASFWSGGTPAMHGIVGNDWFDKATRKTGYCVEDNSVLGVGTLSPTNKAGKMSPRNYTGSNLSDEMRLRFGSKVVGVSMKDRGAILPAGKQPAGAYWFESKSGNFVTSTYYKKELPAWVQAFNDRKLPASYVGQTWSRLLDKKFYRDVDDAPGEGLLTGEKKPVFDHTIHPSKTEGFETFMPTPFGNQLLLEFAKATIDAEKLGQGDQPDVLCVSFSAIDYCGHKFGPNSQEVQDITLRMDRQLAELFTHLDQKIGLANVTMVLTADHGVAPTPEYAASQGINAQRFKELEFMVELMSKLSERFGPGKYFLTPEMYDGNIFFNHDTLKASKLSVAEITSFIRDYVLSTGKFQAAYTREQLLDGRAPGAIGQMVLNGYHPERGGDMVLLLKPYQVPSSTTSKGGTTHGSPYAYDTHIPVLFYGQPFKPGRYADSFHITDIVPTLCVALGVSEPAVSVGKPFLKALAGRE